MKENYQLLLDGIIKENEKQNIVLTLLLHSCCGPCSSYCLEYLSNYFKITVFYYNPNIYPSEEYFFRVDEQRKLIDKLDCKYPVNMIVGKYDVDRFYKTVKGMEKLKEGSQRCHLCYELRLREAATIAKSEGFDYFTTTLTISPYKNSTVLNEIGKKIEEEIGVKHLPSDFKKRNGYKRSVELSRMFGMYRQDYCGCIFSKMEREAIKKLRETS